MRSSDNAALNYMASKLNTGLPARVIKKTVTFAAATTGTVATHDLFTITGVSACIVLGVCKTDLVGATATIEVGIPGSTDGLIATTDAPDIDENELWRNNTPVKILALNSTNFPINVISEKIVYKIATAAISAGVIDFYCMYTPISMDAKIE
jgi:hypothetical protein